MTYAMAEKIWGEYGFDANSFVLYRGSTCAWYQEDKYFETL